MSSYNRSTGSSFSKSDKTGKLGRGMRIRSGKVRKHGEFSGNGIIEPEQVAAFFAKDSELLVRQTVSILDKVIRKPWNLRGMALETYVDRTKIAVELWQKIERALIQILSNENDKVELDRLRSLWLSKVHPYAKHDFNPDNPQEDENAKFIKEHIDNDVKRSEAQGRWHKALWKTKGGKPDYEATSNAIFLHLLKRETKIGPKKNGKFPDYRDRKTGSKNGIATRRGCSISKSVLDPRKPEKSFTPATWIKSDEDMYFEHDPVAEIYGELVKLRKKMRIEAELPVEARPRQKTGLRKELFGNVLYKHFGKVVGEFEKNGFRDQESKPKDRLWALHNEVRAYYKRIAAGDRIRIALRSKNDEELTKVIATNKGEMLGALKAISRNSEISQFIRLGKLIVHASDMPEEEKNADEWFKTRIAHLATSDGQSEIKRNEAFTRIWRNSVGLSLRTLKGWADREEIAIVRTNGKKLEIENNDLASANVAKKAVNNLDSEHFTHEVGLIFGNKLDSAEYPISRSSILSPANPEDQKEILWAFLRLAGEVRNRTNHFTTRPRLTKLLTSGILTGAEPNALRALNQRPGNEVSQTALDAFNRLLDFDFNLQKQAIVDDLNRLKVANYLDLGQVTSICEQLAMTKENASVTLPKFMSVLRRVDNLSKNSDVELDKQLQPFALLDLSNLSKESEGENHFRLGILRHLYATGFRAWMANPADVSKDVEQAVNAVKAGKRARSLEYQSTRGKKYQFAENLLEDLAPEEHTNIELLSAALAARSAADGKTVRNYRPDRAEQQSRSNEVETLKQEIFAHLFAAYLRNNKLGWIWSISENPNADETEITSAMIDIPQPEIQPWHAQFYAWLYLVAPDDISLLRHQFRKSAALEAKAEGEADAEFAAALAEMDRLMSLYTKVQSAGFDGNEHAGVSGLKEVLYEDPALFDKVFSTEYEDHHLSIPGTRRGLRQMLRYGHFDILISILKKHKVTEQEVLQFEAINKTDTKDLFQRRTDLHNRIVENTRQRDIDEPKLKQLIAEYRDKAVEGHRYNFDISAARLTEYANLHQLMMHIVGRLTDYTLIWERDRIYIFLGMLYRQSQENDSELKFCLSSDLESIQGNRSLLAGIQLCDAMRNQLVQAFQGDEFQIENPNAGQRLMQGFAAKGFLPLWNQQDGFVLNFFSLYKHLLNKENRKTFDRYFEGGMDEHPGDEAAKKKAIEDATSARPPLYKLGRQQIRNDFAHYNVIGKSWQYNDRQFSQKVSNRINLSYLVNTVRSLLAYDRKLKNAVSKSIARIVQEDGLYIDWKMKNDRLKNASITPCLQPHLTMLRGDLADQHKFALPATSVRYTSMVQALFDFGNSGHRLDVKIGQKPSSKGPLRYPDRTNWDPASRVPDAMFYEIPGI